MIAGTYEEGRAEGLASALIAILDAISDLERFDPEHRVTKDVGAYVATNVSWKSYVALRDIATDATEMGGKA